MASSSIGLVEALQLIVLMATGFGLVWKIAQLEKSHSDRINIQAARIDVLIGTYKNDLSIIALKLDHLIDKEALAINGLNERISHNRTRWEEELEKIRKSINDLQGFLEKHHNFVPKN